MFERNLRIILTRTSHLPDLGWTIWGGGGYNRSLVIMEFRIYVSWNFPIL